MKSSSKVHINTLFQPFMRLHTSGLFGETMCPLLLNLVLNRFLSHKTKNPNIIALFTSLYAWEKDLQKPKQYPDPRDIQEAIRVYKSQLQNSRRKKSDLLDKVTIGRQVFQMAYYLSSMSCGKTY